MKPLARPSIIKELLEEAGAGKPKQNGKAFILTCPRCEKKDKLYIRKSDGRFVCWVCKERSNFQGSPEYVFAELTGRPIAELRGLIHGDSSLTGEVTLDVSIKDFFDEEDGDDFELVAQPLQPVELDPDFRDLDSVWAAPGVEYLQRRGIPKEIALQYGIMYWPAERRVVFPVSSHGKTYGWQSRTIDPDKWIGEDGEIYSIPKALTYSGLRKDRALMFSDRINAEHAVLCEGPIDAIKAHLCGGNVASLGKAVSKYQLNLLVNSGIKRLYLGLDPDASEEVAGVVRKLSDYDIDLYDMRPPTGDLGGMTFDQVYDLYKNAPKVNAAHLFISLKEWNE